MHEFEPPKAETCPHLHQNRAYGKSIGGGPLEDIGFNCLDCHRFIAEPPKAEQEPTIQCPSCGCAGGNTVDRTKGLTLRCQYCGWPSQPKADAGTLEAAVEARIEQAAAGAELYGHLYARDALRDALAELRRRQEWKESAMAALARWHALGDALTPFAEVRLGMDIPTELTSQIRAKLRASSPDLRALVEKWEQVETECTVDDDSEAAKVHRAFARGVKRCRLELESALTGTGEQK